MSEDKKTPEENPITDGVNNTIDRWALDIATRPPTETTEGLIVQPEDLRELSRFFCSMMHDQRTAGLQKIKPDPECRASVCQAAKLRGDCMKLRSDKDNLSKEAARLATAADEEIRARQEVEHELEAKIETNRRLREKINGLNAEREAADRKIFDLECTLEQVRGS